MPASFYERACAYHWKSDFDKVIADLGTAIALRPDWSPYYELRGAFRIAKKDYSGGRADLLTAVRLHPGDAAAKFEDWPKTKLTADDLRHGERQVEQMLKDRPAMAAFGEKAATLRQWAMRKFAGEDLGKKIIWDASTPESESSAENIPPSEGKPGRIRLRARQRSWWVSNDDRVCEDLWSDAVFELYNVTNGERFGQLERDASAGKLSKQEFATRAVTIESRAAEKLRKHSPNPSLAGSIAGN